MLDARGAALALLLAAPWPAAPAGPETDLGRRVWIRPLTAHAWLVRSVSPLEGHGDVESNAVLVAGPAESVLVDTPATDAQTEPVLAWAEAVLHRPVRHAIFTHWHADRMGGIGAVLGRHAETYALERTRALARQAGRPVPGHALATEARLTLAGVRLEVFYPGPGHTADNVVVWFADDALLDGGCLVKGTAATSLGNAAESDPLRWAAGVEAVQRRYPGARVVVPGHGAAGGAELLVHTAQLLAPNAP